jgi:adenylate cyclase
MAQKGFKRKLTAILSADVVGYCRLMEDNEEATIQTLNTYRNSMTTLVQQHRGRVVDTTGDNLLAEFSSVVDAVKCAVETQKDMHERNADLPKNRRMLFRMGVNLGDIVEEDDRIYGDGVNIAARLEGLAEAGGICISRIAYDQVKNKLELGYEYLGEHSVKNISEPVHVYKVLTQPEAAGKVIGEKRKERRRLTLAAVIVLLIAAGGLAGWYLYIEQAKRIEPASVEKMAFPLPDRPSIAVLPFTNMSADPEQEYFSDGITEEIITALSKIPKLFVIARNSTFTYKGKPVKIQHVSEELGVQYVVEGSVRKAEDRVRITAQLIDALSGRHIWAEKYDRNVKDIFELQDDITLNILKALQLKIPEAFQLGLGAGTDNLEAYLKYLKGVDYQLQGIAEVSKSLYELARKFCEEAISLDPKYAAAYCSLGFIYLEEANVGLSESPEDAFKKAYELAEKTLSLDSSLPCGHSLLAIIYLFSRQHDEAIAASKRALDLNPNSAFDISIASQVLTYLGKFEEAISLFEKYLRLDPYPPEFFYDYFCNACFLSGQFEKPVPLLKTATKRFPNSSIVVGNLAVAYNLLGRTEEAREYFEKYKKTPVPLITREALNWYINLLPFKNQSDAEHLKKLCLKAGLGGDMTQSKSN